MSRQHIDQNGERCAEDDPWASPICVESGSRDAERSIVVIGSSHAMAYWGMAWETVNETGMDAHIRSYGSPGCLYFGVNPAGESACAAMWHTAFDYVTETKPDLVIVLGTVSQPDGPDDLYDGSLSESFGFNLADIGPTIDLARSTGETDIVVIRDVPRQPEPPADCAEQHGFEADQCVYPLNPPPAELDEFSESVVNAGAVWVDLQDVICPDGECRPSMGGIATYVDSHHITATMSRSLAQVFADQVHPSIPWWPSRVWDAA
ncbi:MAG: SGNH hydrolase domain-containing protein [Pseudoclavibacter sp.]